MSWGAVVVGVVGAGVSAWSASKQRKAAKDAADKAGAPQPYDRYTEKTPWGPSVDYRTEGMDLARGLLGDNYGVPKGGYGGGGSGASGGGRGKGRGGGGGGMGRSNSIADAMFANAQAGNPAIQQGLDYMTNSLTDPYGGNALLGDAFGTMKQFASGAAGSPYMGETFDAAKNLENAQLNEFVTGLMGAYMPGGTGGDYAYDGLPGWAMDLYNQGTSSIDTDAGDEGPVGAAAYIKEILEGKYLGPNPYIDSVIAGITDDYQAGLGGLSSAAETQGMYGSGSHQLADAQQAALFQRGIGQVRFEDYNARMGDLIQTLGYGTDLDIATMGNNTSRQGIAGNMQASMFGDLLGYDTSLRRLGLDEQLGNRELILGGTGQQNDLKKFGLGTMADVAGMDNEMRMFGANGMMQGAGLLSDIRGQSLSMIPEYAGFDMDQLGKAFDASFGLDQLRSSNRFKQMAAEEAARNAAWGRNRQTNQDKWANMGKYADLINAFSGDYGTVHEWGTNPGNPAAAANIMAGAPDPWLEGVKGGMGAYNWYQGTQNTGGGGGGAPPMA